MENKHQSDTLYIIIPAYNEEETIETVAREWHAVVEKIGGDSRLVIINDGSKDRTMERLDTLSSELKRLIPITKANSGHGGTVMFGYKYALENGASYIFQTDADGQTIPDEFWQLWESRHIYDIQIGHRKGRKDGLSRIIVTKVLKLVLFFSFGLWIVDANTPFRLMSAETLGPKLAKIPKDYNLSNVILTVQYEKAKSKMRYIPITFRPRQGGTNSINLRKISRIGIKAVNDFSAMKRYI